MKQVLAIFAATVVVFGAIACASRKPDETPIEAEAIQAHFAAARACDVFVSELIKPVVMRVRTEDTISGLRQALVSMPEHEFSLLILRVQQSAHTIKDFDALTDNSQFEVSKIFYDRVAELPSFGSSRCRGELYEVVMDHLYWKLGGEKAGAVVELRKHGVKGHSEMQVVLMTALLGPN